MNDEAVYRTAPATPGLLITISEDLCQKRVVLGGFSKKKSETVLCKMVRFFALTSIRQDASFELNILSDPFFKFLTRGTLVI